MPPLSLAFFLVSLKSGALAARFGARVVMTSGLVLMGLGFLILSTFSRGIDIVLIEFAFLQIGIGLGLNTGPLLSVGLAAAPKLNTGAAAGIVNMARMVGATWEWPCSAVSLPHTPGKTPSMRWGSPRVCSPRSSAAPPASFWGHCWHGDGSRPTRCAPAGSRENGHRFKNRGLPP
jgi:MFS family permease